MLFDSGATVGNYRVVRSLGKGGMGEVYEVEHVRLGVRYALKAFVLAHGDVELLRERFVAEGKVLARLQHPNLVRVFELDLDASTGALYFVMDLVSGCANGIRSFADLEDNAADEADLWRWFCQLCSALDYIHAHGIVHRDIKPSNILVDGDGNVRLVDFGVSRYVTDAVREELSIAQKKLGGEWRTGTFNARMGTGGFMAPEVRSGRPATPAADAYSLGLVFFRLLTGMWYEPHRNMLRLLEPLEGNWRIVLEQLLNEVPNQRPAKLAALTQEPAPEERPVGAIDTEPPRRTFSKRHWYFIAVAIVASAIVTSIVSTKEPSADDSQPLRVPVATNAMPMAVTNMPLPIVTNEVVFIVTNMLQTAKTSNAPLSVSMSDIPMTNQRSLKSSQYESDSQYDKLAFALKKIRRDRWHIDGEMRDSVLGDVKVKALSPTAYGQYIDRVRNALRNYDELESAVSNIMSRMTTSQIKMYETELQELDRKDAETNWHHDTDKKWQVETIAKVDLARRQLAEWHMKSETLVAQKDGPIMPGENLNVEFDGDVHFSLIWCPSGIMTMGSTPTEQGRYSNETQHKVKLTQGFWIADRETSQGLWKAVMGNQTVVDLARLALHSDEPDDVGAANIESHIEHANIWTLPKDIDPSKRCGDVRDNYPVYYVSWEQATNFCARLTDIARKEIGVPKRYVYRLPTEAEWEYACRAGSLTSLPNNRPLRILRANVSIDLDEYAWFGGNSCNDFSGTGFDVTGWSERMYEGELAAPHKCATRKPNAWGIYDMLGNVWEWCYDWYGNYPTNDVINPKGPASGHYHVVRGGSWSAYARQCRAAYRDGFPSGLGNFIGFRVVLGPMLESMSDQVQNIVNEIKTRRKQDE